MNHFQPTFGVKDASLNVKEFIKSHKSEFKHIMGKIMPFLIITACTLIYVNHFLLMDAIEVMKNGSVPKTVNDIIQNTRDMQALSYSKPLYYVGILLQVLLAYCFAVLAVSWHRLILLGADNCEPMSFLKPKKHEIEFIMMWTMIGIIIPHVLSFLMNLNMASVIISTLVLPYIFLKISFYFPAKAVNSHITFVSSFKLTKGYVWKMFLALIRANLKLICILLVVSIIIGAVGGGIALAIFSDEITSSYMKGAYQQVAIQPLQVLVQVLYFQPLFTVLGVSVLSNYYQYALQNKLEGMDVRT